MTLWNLIRDFFVENLFGGINSSDEYFLGNKIGQIVGVTDGIEDTFEFSDTALPFVKIGEGTFGDIFTGVLAEKPNTYLYTSIGDWLSTTFTIITLILLVIFLYIFVKWIFKLFSGLLR